MTQSHRRGRSGCVFVAVEHAIRKSWHACARSHRFKALENGPQYTESNDEACSSMYVLIQENRLSCDQVSILLSGWRQFCRRAFHQ